MFQLYTKFILKTKGLVEDNESIDLLEEKKIIYLKNKRFGHIYNSYSTHIIYIHTRISNEEKKTE